MVVLFRHNIIMVSLQNDYYNIVLKFEHSSTRNCNKIIAVDV